MKLLIIDGDSEYLRNLPNYTEGLECEITLEKDAIKAIAFHKENNFDVVICDSDIKYMTKTDFLKNIKAVSPHTLVIVSENTEESHDSEYISTGAFTFYEKPVSIESIKKVTELNPSLRLYKENHIREARIIIGRFPCGHYIRRKIEFASQISNFSVCP